MIHGKVEQALSDETMHSHSETPSINYTRLPRKSDTNGNNDADDEDWHSVDSSTSVLDASDILAFRAYSNNRIGQFIVYSGGVRFVQSLTKKEIWRRTFLELAEMRKLKGSFSKNLTMKPREQLELKLIDGEIILLEAIKHQDEAFNAVIGYSSLQWQALQPLQT